MVLLRVKKVSLGDAHIKFLQSDGYNSICIYKLEESYRKDNQTPEQVQTRRNEAETTAIIESIRNEMIDLLAQTKETLSDLMNKALNYLHTFGKQLFAYRNYGEYTIDNTVAERVMCPITEQSKNSMFFRSVEVF